MAKSLQKEHWLVHVLRRAGIPGGDELALDPGMLPAEAWVGTCDAMGLSEEDLAAYVADYFRLKVASLDTAEPTAIKLVPEKISRQYSIFPLRENHRNLIVATSDPTNFAAEQALGFISGRKALFEVAPPPFILHAINASYSGDGVTESLRTRGDQATADSVSEARQGPSPGPRDERAGEEVGEITDATEDVSAALAGDLARGETLGLDGDAYEASLPSGPGMALRPSDGDRPILIVDDDPEDRLLLRTILQKHGFTVEEARDGSEALERIGNGDLHALVVLDLEMPTLGGREVLAALRSSGRTVTLPVLVLTGSPDPEDEDRLMDVGADDYLRKPLDPPRFVARVKATLRRARMA